MSTKRKSDTDEKNIIVTRSKSRRLIKESERESQVVTISESVPEVVVISHTIEHERAAARIKRELFVLEMQSKFEEQEFFKKFELDSDVNLFGSFLDKENDDEVIFGENFCDKLINEPIIEVDEVGIFEDVDYSKINFEPTFDNFDFDMSLWDAI